MLIFTNYKMSRRMQAAATHQWRSQRKNWGLQKIWMGKMYDVKRITLFCLEKRLSRNKMIIFSKNLGDHGPFAPPGYAYATHLRNRIGIT